MRKSTFKIIRFHYFTFSPLPTMLTNLFLLHMIYTAHRILLILHQLVEIHQIMYVLPILFYLRTNHFLNIRQRISFQ